MLPRVMSSSTRRGGFELTRPSSTGSETTKSPHNQRVTISDAVLEQLSELSDRCDPPPWRAMIEGRDHAAGDSFIQVGSDSGRGEDIYVTRDSGPADASFLDLIASARTYLPEIIAELRQRRLH
jgi:hypothetical protein